MILTNKYGLPTPFETYIRSDKYSKGDADYSVTELIDSPRVRVLRKHYQEQMSEDVSDRLWSVIGTAVHSILEEAAHFDHQSESRLFSNVGGKRVSGAMDIIEETDNGLSIIDFKVTSVWSILYGKPEWANQLNMYSYLVEANQARLAVRKKVSRLQVCVIIRDWMRKKAETTSDYPNAPIVMIDIPKWSFSNQKKYMHERVKIHADADEVWARTDNLPLCTDAERWARDDTYALKKKGLKRASKLFDSLQEATRAAEDSGPDYIVEHRHGESVRCTGDYCGVAQWCDQYNKKGGC